MQELLNLIVHGVVIERKRKTTPDLVGTVYFVFTAKLKVSNVIFIFLYFNFDQHF